ncbi:HAD family hydrolase [Hymenobacter sp. HSC-4F20]|uniref:HAD family hydrolase n=1 Tax=Hymenobacter sp. HSC-4F20 TaxID=2864135 RepID=UPI001C733FFA|nr:HAD family hydrolase [Hymenobacter sp. HSC-4F20]MBX0293076.1 HAD family hydrolase [Hymenobacter sp. HSC-4F20]
MPASHPPVQEFQEVPGQGLRGWVHGWEVRVCLAAFVGVGSFAPAAETPAAESTATTDGLLFRVYISADGTQGCYLLRNAYREELRPILTELSRHYRLAVLSGDNDTGQDRLHELFGPETELRFRQSPQQKLDYVARLRQQGRTVIMVGDGLNDAGARQQADAGIAFTDTLTNFSPACDAILDAGSFGQLSTFLPFP